VCFRKVILAALLLAGCGDLPQPLLGNPGAAGRRLAQPPPARLTIPVPTQSLLTDGAARLWANATAAALQAQEIPAIAGTGRPVGWRLMLSAETRGRDVVPTYTVQDPAGVPQGTSQGPAVPARSWFEGAPATFKTAAESEAASVVTLLNHIEAARQQSDPNSLVNRPAKLYFAGVTGAPGDGDRALTQQMLTRLPNLGDLVQDTAKDADFTVAGHVKTAPGANGATRVELQWVVTDPKGEERGRVVQLNEVPPHTIDAYWGDVAMVAATEAASGVHEVVVQQTGRAAEKGADNDHRSSDLHDPGGTDGGVRGAVPGPRVAAPAEAPRSLPRVVRGDRGQAEHHRAHLGVRKPSRPGNAAQRAGRRPGVGSLSRHGRDIGRTDADGESDHAAGELLASPVVGWHSA